ncbi:RNA 2'-phosphotransferase [bacterium]|nr:RNA 2'-phosphotransferase [bacterium]
MTTSSEKQISKLLSLVLRHSPETIGIELDQQGWTNVNHLITKVNEYGTEIKLDQLKAVVANSDKQRFSFNEDGTKIRANQGHSVPIDLGFIAKNPPPFLYHGTATKNKESILQFGLKKQARHHVHLSKDIETAVRVGQRHGKPIIFKISTKLMLEKGHEFYESANGVWLTEAVPAEFLIILEKDN